MFTKATNRNSRNRIPVSQFRPQNEQERVIYEIARTLHEPYIDYLKSVYDRFGYQLIWNAWQEYRSAIERGANIRNPRKFFTYIVEEHRRRER